MDKITDAYVEKTEEVVKEAKKNRKWKHESMILSMRDKEKQKIGEEKMLMLIQRLAADQRFDEIEKINDDKSIGQNCIESIILSRKEKRFLWIAIS